MERLIKSSSNMFCTARHIWVNITAWRLETDEEGPGITVKEGLRECDRSADCEEKCRIIPGGDR